MCSKRFFGAVLILILAASSPLISSNQAAWAVEKCTVLASQDELKERAARLKKLLQDKAYAALEDELSTKLALIEQGKYNDELLRQTLDRSFTGNPEFAPLLSEWIRLYPRSYAARISRAEYYLALGYRKRGTKLSVETSEEQFGAMRDEFKKALADIKEAILLSESYSLAFAQMLRITKATGGESGRAAVLREAQRRFPKSAAVMAVAVVALDPRWGGSFEELDELITFARKAAVPDDDLRFLQYEVEMQKGNYFEVITRQKSRAVEHYRAAGEFCESIVPWEKAVRASYTIEDWPGLVIAANRLLTLQPTDRFTTQRRGWAYEKMQKMPDAIKDYEIAAALGSAWAQNKLGWMLWRGEAIAKDLSRAKKLFEQAAAQGDKNAQANLIAINAELSKNAPGP